MKKLGIFYTNNEIATEILDLVVENIQKAAEFSQVDLVACSYTPIQYWKAERQQSKIHNSGILSLAIQVLQLLYSYRNKGYDVVSFLEHDVLYPINYFTYPDFTNNFLHCTDYRQLTTKGFQSYYWDCYPLFTLTMQYEFAIKHFVDILEKMLTGNYWILEPQQIDVLNYANPLSLMHIKHGRNTTSFYNYFTGEDKEDSQWGVFNDYYQRFKWNSSPDKFISIYQLAKELDLPPFLFSRYLNKEWTAYGYPYLPEIFTIERDHLHPEEVNLFRRIIKEHCAMPDKFLELRNFRRD